jgi:hypothetical protein
MEIMAVTVTGADDDTNQDDLLAIQQDYPFVEFGILFSQSKAGVPRYPSIEWASKLSPNLNLSAHLCGQWVGNVVEEGNFSFWIEDDDFANKFKRIQLNCHKQRLRNLLNSEAAWSAISESPVPVIIGGNFANIAVDEVKFAEHNAQVLFDASGGHGKLTEKWPTPFSKITCGYAGGLRPENIVDQLKNIEEVAPDVEIWIDMESGVRDRHDKFSISKVRECLQHVQGVMSADG